MKKRKLIFLLPIAAMALGACGAEEPKDEPGQQEGGGDQEKQLMRVTLVSAPETVVQGGSIEPAQITLKAAYKDGTDEQVAATRVELDTSEPGEVMGKAYYGEKFTNFTITVVSQASVVHVTGISKVSGQQYSVTVGKTTTIGAVVSPEDATDQSLIFTTSKEGIVSITSDGTLTGLAEGSVDITVTSHDNPQASFKIEGFKVVGEAVALPTATVKGYEMVESGDLVDGDYVQFIAEYGGHIYGMPTYTTGNNIKVKELAVSSDLIDDTANDGLYVIVKNDDNTYSFRDTNGKYLDACGGNSSNYLRVTDTIKSTSKFTVSITDGKASIVCADKDTARGYLYLNGGSQMFSCYASKDGIEGYPLVSLFCKTPEQASVESVEFLKSSYTLEEGGTVEVEAKVLPVEATDKEIAYSLKDVNPAGALTIEGNVITAVGQGTATVVATSHDGGKTAEVTVTAVAGINYGTEDSPITVSEASTIIANQCANPNDTTRSAMVIQGEVKDVKNVYDYADGPSFEFDITDGSKDLYVYRCKGTAAQKEDFGVGAIVKLSAKAKKYSGTFELCDVGDVKSTMLSVTPCEKHVSEIVSVSAPETVTQNASLILDDVDVVVNFLEGGQATIHPDSIDLDTSVAGKVTGTVHVGTFTKTFEITVTAAKENKFVEAYEAALKLSSGVTAEYYFEGVVVGKRANEYFVQYNGYGIDLYNPSTAPSVGDKVGVTATLQNYKGLVETKTISSISVFGKETIPEPAQITSYEVYTGLKQNILCDIEAEVLEVPTVTSGKDYTLKVGFGSDKIPFYIKSASLSKYTSVLEKLAIGDDVKIEGAITSIFNTAQLIAIDDTKLTKVVHAVTGVSLDKEELTLEAGGIPTQLVATVAPENATNKELTWESSNPAVATVVDGLVTPLVEGSTIITVKTVENELTATCLVSVSAATRTLTSVTATGLEKTTYNVGETLDLTGLVVTAHYDDSSSDVITTGYTTNIALDKKLETTDTSLVISFGGKSAEAITLTINEVSSFYTQLTKVEDVVSGSYIIAAKVGDDYVGIDSKITLTSSKIKNCSNVTVSSGAVSATDAAKFVLTLEVNDGKVNIKDGNGQYLGYSSSTNLSLSTTPYDWGVKVGENGTFRIYSIATNTRALSFRAGEQNCFGPYAESNIKKDSTEYFDLELFKL